MKKKLLSVFLSLCLALPLLPAAVLAASATSVTVGGVVLNSTGAGNIAYAVTDDTGIVTTADATADNWNIKFENGVLTLRDATIQGPNVLAAGANSSGIFSENDLTIALTEKNTVIGGTSARGSSFGVYMMGGRLTITGSGSLIARSDTVTAGNSYAVYGRNDIFVESNVTAAGGSGILSGGIVGTGSVTIASGNVTAIGGQAGDKSSFGLYGKAVTISGGSVTAVGGQSLSQNCYGVYSSSECMKISGGSVTAVGGQSKWGFSFGLYNDVGGITISGSPNITAVGGQAGQSSAAINSNSDGIAISGGTVVAVGGTASQSSNGISSNGISSNGISSNNRSIAISGGLLVAKCADGTNNSPTSPTVSSTLGEPLASSNDYAVWGDNSTAYYIQAGNVTKDTVLDPAAAGHITWDGNNCTLANAILLGGNSGTDDTSALTIPSGGTLTLSGFNTVLAGDTSAFGKNSFALSCGGMTVNGTGSVSAIGGVATARSAGIESGSDVVLSDKIALTAIGGTGASSSFGLSGSSILGGTGAAIASGSTAQAMSSAPTAATRLITTGAYTGNAMTWRPDTSAPAAEAAPTATVQAIVGTPAVGKTLTGRYSYRDVNGDLQGASRYQWYRSDDSSGTGKTEISGATAKTYLLKPEDEGKYLSFEVTPLALTGTLEGSPVESARMGPIGPEAPSIEVGGQTGKLTYGHTETTASFSLLAKAFSKSPTGCTVTWYTDGAGITETGAPSGITMTNTGLSSLTASITGNPPADSYYFRVTAFEGTQSAQSDVVTLTVNPTRSQGLTLNGSISYTDTKGATQTANPFARDITDSAEGWAWYRTASSSYNSSQDISATNHPSNTLILSGAFIKADSGDGVIVPNNSTVVLAAGTANHSVALRGTGIAGIADGTLTLCGSGTLTAASGQGSVCGIYANNILINGGNITATSPVNGILAPGTITINAGTVNAISKKPENSAAPMGDGISGDSGVFIHGGTVYASGNNNGIFTRGNNNGGILISGGNTTAIGIDGIWANQSSVTITGGTVNTTGNNPDNAGNGIYGTTGVFIRGGSITATATGSAVTAERGAITIQDPMIITKPDGAKLNDTKTKIVASDGTTVVTEASFRAPATSSGSSGGSSTPSPVTEIKSDGSFTASNLDRLVSGGKTLTVSGASGAKLSFSTEALKGINDQTSDSITVKIADVSGKHQDTHPGKAVYSLGVVSNGKPVTNFGGSVTVTLPYTLKDGEKAENIGVWYLAGDGSMTEIPCTYDAKTGLVTFTVTHFSNYMVGAKDWVNPFTDVTKSSYYYDAVAWASVGNVTGGTTASTFAPDNACTRAQTVTFLWRAMGSPEPASKINPFTDVAADAYYYKAVLWAVEKGITKGTDATTFSPDDTVSRGQVVTFQHRAAGSPAANATNPFGDLDAGAYYESAVLWAVNKKITQGTTAATFSPSDDCTRAQIITFLYRQLGK